MKRTIDDGVDKLNGPKKPVFLTKEERQKLSLQRRHEEVAHQKRRSELPLAASSSVDKDPNRDGDRRKREREREDEQNAREIELSAIKEQYLGCKKAKKRVIEKFRFSFDWENTEDTGRDMNSLYQNLHEALLLFGRGFRAGMDRREQKKLAAKNEKEIRDVLLAKDGNKLTRDEAHAHKEEEEAADMYDTFDMKVDRHWSEKVLDEMTERLEDFQRRFQHFL